MTRSTTIINSEDGQTVLLPEDVAFPSGVRHVEVIKLADCGHSPYKDQPDATLRAIEAFVRRVLLQ